MNSDPERGSYDLSTAVLSEAKHDAADYAVLPQSVKEGLPQALARLVPDRPLHRDIGDRASVVPPDQQEDRQRLRQQLVDEVTREPVEGEDKGRGYEYAKNAYIPVDCDELRRPGDRKQTHHRNPLVRPARADRRAVSRQPYYITPDGQVGQDAFAVTREATRGKGMVALGRVVLAKRERVVMLQPWDKGLTATTLRYPYEIRDAKEYFDEIPDVKVEPDMLKLAEHILQSKARNFDPPQFVDHYEEAVVAMQAD